MRRNRRLFALAAAMACAAACTLASPALAAPAHALTATDARLYADAFDAASRGDFDTASQAVGKVSDKCLAGYVEYRRLMQPQKKSTFQELADWLKKYADLPSAVRVFALAKKRDPHAAAGLQLSDMPANEVMDAGGSGQSARDAFAKGDNETAYRLASDSGDRWIAGLAAFRMGRYGEAIAKLQQIAVDADADEWVRSAGAYWAARAAIASGTPEAAPDYLKIAARYPTTFYGMVAERQLGLDPGFDGRQQPIEPELGIIKASYTGNSIATARLIASDPRAKRAVALMQLGLRDEAVQELKAGLSSARSDEDRRLWTTLTLELNGPQMALAKQRGLRGSTFDPDRFPTSGLDPKGGFTIDKAMVYAIVRQESRFDPRAVSGAGAIGLMQLMPQTAARAAGDDKLLRDSSPLYDPATNLRIGQEYFDLLLRKATNNDLLRAVAAYNGGYGSVMRAENGVGADDGLMVMETLPYAQTRDYVEKVMANYWIYRRLFGKPTHSLDAVASGSKVVDVRLDR
jgi:soluble lytic murein transglycosylase-like protein